MSQQKKYRAKIINRKNVARDTISLSVTTPDGFTYKAGQYTVMYLPQGKTPFDEKGNSRFLSLASAPSERHLLFVARLGNSVFKDQYVSLPEGSEIIIDEAGGKITIPDEPSELVFLAGGIGVTPFRSIVKEIVERKLSLRTYLFHSNREKKDNPFWTEFETISHKYPDFTYVPTITREKDESDGIYSGRITAELIRQHISDTTAPTYYIVGSHSFISGMQQQLNGLKIPKEKIVAEVFCGYCPEHVCCCDHI